MESQTEPQNQLKKGQDSGSVKPAVKIYVALNSGGKCCNPECGDHLTRDETKTTECAHIIPKKVGFVREDWQTPLEDRRKATNLIYVCNNCHEIIDNRENEHKFTTEKLREWKKNHEEKIRNKNNDTNFVPKSIEDAISVTLHNLDKKLQLETNVSAYLVEQLLDSSKELLRGHYLDKAETVLAQIEILLSEFSDKELKYKFQSRKAILLSKQGRLDEAKIKYRDILKSNMNPDDLFDYIELCQSAPHESDQLDIYQEGAESDYSKHPRLALQQLIKKYKDGEKISGDVEETKWSDDDWINARFYNIYALLFDQSGQIERRNEFLKKWEEMLPLSPRPVFFKAMFSTNDFQRSGAHTRKEIEDHIASFLEAETKTKSDKYWHLSLSDQMLMIVQKIHLYSAVSQVSSVEPEEFVKLRDEFISIIDRTYFDLHTDYAAVNLLEHILIEKDQWHIIFNSINDSKMRPSDGLIDLLSIHGIRLDIGNEELIEFAKRYQRDDIEEIVNQYINQDWNSLAANLKNKSARYVFQLLQSIGKPECTIYILDELEFEGDAEIDALYPKLKALVDSNNLSDALELAKSIDIHTVNLHFLDLINYVANRCDESRLIIDTGELILKNETPEAYRAGLSGKIACAYSKFGDDRKAYEYAEKALENPDHLETQNTIVLIWLAVTALVNMNRASDVDELACRHARYIAEEPGLGILFADSLLKSAVDDKEHKALSYVTDALRNPRGEIEKVYLGAALVLNELVNIGVIELRNEPKITNDVFVKLEGIPDFWYFLGDDSESFDAIALRETDDRYNALAGKSLGDTIDWPADRYTSGNSEKKVANIVIQDVYLKSRSHEAMEATVKRGDQFIWSVEVLNNDGSVNKSNLLSFYREKFGNNDRIVNQYCDSVLPFSLLCRSEGSIQGAIGRIVGENRGFIRCNGRTPEGIRQEHQTAEAILDGTPFFIDSLASLMLGEAGLLSKLMTNTPNLHVATSVVKTLREIANNIRPAASSKGRMAVVNGQIRVSEGDQEKETEFAQRIHSSADLLDASKNKIIGNIYEEHDYESEYIDLDSFFPSWIVDSIKLAADKSSAIVTDDIAALQCYRDITKETLPDQVSSISLVRLMYERKMVSWEDYLKYFYQLSSYRYYFLSISVDDMERSVLGKSKGGLVLFTPKNIDYLNLALTFSEEYGVQDRDAIRISTVFLGGILLRDDIPENVSEDIFSRLIVGILHNRDGKLWGNAIINICSRAVSGNMLASALTYRKLELLEQQIKKYAREFNPIVQNVPSLLKSGKYL